MAGIDERNGHEDDGGASGLGEEFDGGQLGGTGENEQDDSGNELVDRLGDHDIENETERDTGHAKERCRKPAQGMANNENSTPTPK